MDTAAAGLLRVIVDALQIEGVEHRVDGQRVYAIMDGTLVQLTVSVPTWPTTT